MMTGRCEQMSNSFTHGQIVSSPWPFIKKSPSPQYEDERERFATGLFHSLRQPGCPRGTRGFASPARTSFCYYRSSCFNLKHNACLNQWQHGNRIIPRTQAEGVVHHIDITQKFLAS